MFGEVSNSEAPYPFLVELEHLPTAIAQARTREIEFAARLDYWQYLNHPYRNRYREHREAEEKTTQTSWERAHPDQRTWWQKLRMMERTPLYKPMVDRSITFPEFVASPVQRENMLALLGLIEAFGKRHVFEKVELNRELGHFDYARIVLNEIHQNVAPSLYSVSKMLIDQCQSAPARYVP